MKFGVIPPYGSAPIESPDYAVAFARMVEELGFESLWTVEHHVMPVDYESVYPYDASGRTPFTPHVPQPDPLIWLSFVAAATTRLRLATGILILPQHNPVVLAKSAASLDRLSGGRLLLGIGVGWTREEALAVGTGWQDRGERCDEYIEAMRALWRDPVSSYRGKSVSFTNVVSQPKPLQPGGVPILIGGHSARAARRAGELGDGFVPLGASAEQLVELREIVARSARARGRDPDSIELTTTLPAKLAAIEAYADVGVDRVIIASPQPDLEKARARLGAFSDDVIAKLG